MDIAYAAHTESCTFMLDAEGTCNWVVASDPPPEAHAVAARRWEKAQRAASRCIGAQYVASLDVRTPGGLVDMPRVGVPMLFARIDRNGRVSLVRTGPVLRFEARSGDDQPRTYDSGMRERPQEEFDEIDAHRRGRYDERAGEAADGGRARRSLPPPLSPRDMASRLPPPPPVGRPRLPNLPAPPRASRPPSAHPAEEEGYARDTLGPPTVRRIGYPAPLWTDRAKASLRRSR